MTDPKRPGEPMTVTTDARPAPAAAGATPRAAAPPPLLKLEDVRKVFTTEEVETHALAGVHLAIRKGEFVSITGPSGCGKSTLLSILGLLDSPSAGQYWLDGRPVHELAPLERAQI